MCGVMTYIVQSWAAQTLPRTAKLSRLGGTVRKKAGTMSGWIACSWPFFAK